ncbi:MAG: hypothetical protein HFE78_00695 [Clostridiales bacterium]|nr:hypothetical protein [Clostridiales bacterium]
MDIKYLYERVCMQAPIEQDRFLAAVNYTVRELISLYGSDYVQRDGPVRPLLNVNSDPGIYEDYEDALYDNVMYFASNESNYKTDFVAHAQYAYHNVWRKKNKGKRIHREAW